MRGGVAGVALGEVAAVDQDVGARRERTLDGGEVAGVAALHGSRVQRRRAEVELPLAAVREDVDVLHAFVGGEIGRDGVDPVPARIEQHDLRGMVDVLDQGRDVGNVGLDEDHAFRRRGARRCAEVAVGSIEPAQRLAPRRPRPCGRDRAAVCRVLVCDRRVAGRIGERMAARDPLHRCARSALAAVAAAAPSKSDALLERNDRSGRRSAERAPTGNEGRLRMGRVPLGNRR